MPTIDWPNIVSTLVAACLGGWIASRIAARQIQATVAVEREKALRECSGELLQAMDEFLHIAYRDEGDGSAMRRQFLMRRILSLLPMALPEQFGPTQSHLAKVEQWWRAQRGALISKPSGVGLTATETFFHGIKAQFLERAYGVKLA